MTHSNTGASCPIERARLQALLDAELGGVLQEAHAHMFAGIAVLVTPTEVAQMQAVIAATERVVALAGWQQRFGAGLQSAANPGVFFGYDFHLNADGAHLIEINTNAGGAFLNELLLRSQRDTQLPGERCAVNDVAHAIVAMFRSEWALQGNGGALRSIAIVDEAPATQYLYPEFVLARQIFEQAGIQAVIADPAELQAKSDGLYCGELKIDLVYNRLTDFSLQRYPHILAAAQQRHIVLTPHPRAYALYADKRNLAVLTDAAQLCGMGAADTDVATLLAGIPQVREVSGDADSWWNERKQWFFKPATGFGSKGSYRGDKVTRRVFEEIMQGGYVAQRQAAPGEREVMGADGNPAALKFDVRCYVYQGAVQLIAARMYQGQTTNFRTPGGGFALVRVVD
ncbi:MAG TPA: hypothetical protein VIU93_11595 [Gallionellaceae bacterium]